MTKKHNKPKVEPALPGPRSDWLMLLPLGVIAAGMIVYLNSLAVPFIFDDSRILQSIGQPTSGDGLAGWFDMGRRALLDLTLTLNAAIEGENVVGYHLVNMLIHLVAALALFGVVQRTLRLDRQRSRFGRAAPWLAFAIAVIWVVHPLNTQAVTYTIQRGESMMGMFYLLTLYCAIRLLEEQNHRLWLAAAVLCCLAGMATKEVMVTAPFVVVLFDRIFTRFSLYEQMQRRWLLYLLLAATWGWFAIGGLGELTGSTEKPSAGFRYEALTSWQYALTQPLVILKYLKLSLLPFPLVLDHFQPAQHTRFELPQPWIQSFVLVTAPVLVIVSLLAATAWELWRRSPFGFLGAWFFLTLAVTSSFLPIADLMVEHRMYLPLVAVVAFGVMVVHGLLEQAATWLRPVVAVALVAAVVLLFGGLTIRRNCEYQSAISIWQTVVQRAAHNPRGWHNLGSAFDKDRQPDDALRCYERVLEIVPDYDEAHNNIGNIWLGQDRLNMAIKRFKAAAAIAPDDAQYWYNLGRAYLLAGDLDAAERNLRQALELRPNYARAYSNLGMTYLARRDLDRAIAHFETGLGHDPQDLDLYQNLSSALADADRMREAVAVAERAVEAARRAELPTKQLARFIARRDWYRAHLSDQDSP